jgi:hypothetical protein
VIITLEQKLRHSDLSDEFIRDLEGTVRDSIKGDEELMKQISESEKAEFPDVDEAKLKSFIDLKVDDIATETVEKIRIYCDFDLEITL